MIGADSCGVDCHCIIGGPPENGLCKWSAGKDYKFEGTSGESHKFAFKGGGEK
jgi:hypothetical protein